MIEFSRDERRFVLFLCFFLLAGAFLNLARYVSPGVAEKMGFAPEKEEMVFQNMSPADSAKLAGLIERSRRGVERKRVEFPLDLNTAAISDFELLPGVGAVRAAEIVKLRDRLGGFTNVRQLLEVKGIGPATLGKIEPYVTINTGDIK